VKHRQRTLGTFRIGTPRQSGEGLRLGTVRYLPRGVPKRDYARRDYFDVWFPTVAPSRELIRWLRSRPWTPAVQRAYEARYRREMRAPEAARALELLAAISKHTPISIGCYCDDESRCHRSVLHRLINQAARAK
jgi:uncharacterized protein YeaO (DUF488 family)